MNYARAKLTVGQTWFAGPMKIPRDYSIFALEVRSGGSRSPKPLWMGYRALAPSRTASHNGPAIRRRLFKQGSIRVLQ